MVMMMIIDRHLIFIILICVNNTTRVANAFIAMATTATSVVVVAVVVATDVTSASVPISITYIVVIRIT